MAFDMGKTPETTYSMPKGSRRKGLWKHEWKNKPRLLGLGKNMALMKLTGKGKITDFMRH